MKHLKKSAILCLSLLLVGGLTGKFRITPTRYPDFKPGVATEYSINLSEKY